jgi:hypothetical protein
MMIFHATKTAMIDDRDGSISTPVKKLVTPLMPKMDHPMIIFSIASFLRFMNA